MEYLPILLGLSGSFALIYIFKIKNKISRYLTIGALVALILSLIPLGPVGVDGYTLYGLITIVSFFTTFSNDGISKEIRPLLLVFLVFSALLPISFIIRMEGMQFVSLFGFIPIFMLLYFALYKKKELTNEFGYLAIFAAFSLVRAIVGLDLVLN